MKILIDTNVLLSAALRDRLPERVVRFVATRDDWQWIVTPDIAGEYADVLSRPKFRLPANVLREWHDLIHARTIPVSVSLPPVSFPRDPKDAPFLAAAIATGADYLITGDNDLLQSRLPLATRIVSAAEFARIFQIS